MDRGAWWATVHRVAKSWMQLNWLSIVYFVNCFSFIKHTLNIKIQFSISIHTHVCTHKHTQRFCKLIVLCGELKITL